MNLIEFLAAADLYFADHPQGQCWRAESESAARQGALKLAELEVAAYLKTTTVDRTDETLRYAVFEQALHLLRHPDGGADENLVSETIEGVGSRTYRISDTGETFRLSSRSRALLAARTGGGRIGRG